MVFSDALLKAIQLRCTKCNQLKPAIEFAKDGQPWSVRNRYGRRSDCKRCMSNRCNSQRRLVKFLEPEYHAANARGIQLKSRYGIIDFDAMLSKQFGRCAICKNDNPGGKGVFHADHCHRTMKVRGLLCYGCNNGLGKFDDDCFVMASARLYLEHYQVAGDPFQKPKRTPRICYRWPTQEHRERAFKNADLKKLYGIDLAWYEAKLLSQNNGCAICESQSAGGKGMLHVDHCHKTRKNRGLLCHDCNLGVGSFDDDPLIIHKAIAYINRYALAA